MNHFPDCEIFECEQRTPEWFEHRKGVLTASNFGAWLLSKSTVTANKARETAICKCVSELAGAYEQETYVNDAMKRGIELEPEAVKAFEGATSKKIKEVGFCKSLHGRYGCSPDGIIIGEPSGLEGKVPVGSTHIKYRRAGVLPAEYKLQVHGSMAVTGATSWHFQSYSPTLAPFRVVVERDDFTEELKAALDDFSLDLQAAIRDESKAWNLAFGEGGEA